MKTGYFYKLLEDYNGFNKGTIFLLGDLGTMEFFDITTEITTGHSYSCYNIPMNILKEYRYYNQRYLKNLFDNYFDKKQLTQEILTY